ncbi:MAG: glycosyltransferase family 4 protein [Candidatus Magasanikbacteria bacterium]|nr:glycosyltransferase family 4 protein [Candidatus Magasanikbacteria bacterium]
MRVALIGCTVNPRVGGMGRALYDHAVALAEAGQEVTIYTLDSPHPIPLPQGERGFSWNAGELRRLFSFGKAAWGARFDPLLDTYDVVHLHLPFFGVAEEVADCPESRLFVTYHMDAIGTGLKRIYFNWWYRRRFKKVLAACDAIAVTSRAYARESQLAKAGIDVEKCEEIVLRVDTEKFTPHPNPPLGLRLLGPRGAPRGEREDYFLFVGALDRAHYFKGVSLLLRALKLMDSGSRGESGMTEVAGMTNKVETASGMTDKTRLVVVGAGELLSHYKKEAAQLGIADRVIFTGGVTDEELARWYAGALALVLPSTDRSEAFGIVLIEAMACGTPVIASDLPGVRAVVERVQGGVLVPPGDEQALASALKNAWDTSWPFDSSRLRSGLAQGKITERAALAARAASVYGRTTLASQLVAWYRGIIIE